MRRLPPNRPSTILFGLLLASAPTASADLLLLASPGMHAAQTFPPPAPPLSSMSALSRSNAQLSTTYSPSYGSSSTYQAANAIDGDMATYCLSAFSDAPWLSMQVGLSGTNRVGHVVIKPREHMLATMLMPFEIHVASAAGVPSAANAYHRCAVQQSVSSQGPFAIWCGDGSAPGMNYVTVTLTGTGRYLMIAEFEAAKAEVGPL